MKLPKLVTNLSRLSLSLVRVTLAHFSQVVSEITEQVNLLIYVREALPFMSQNRAKSKPTVHRVERLYLRPPQLYLLEQVYIILYIYMPVIIATSRRTTPVKLKTHSDA